MGLQAEATNPGCWCAFNKLGNFQNILSVLPRAPHLSGNNLETLSSWPRAPSSLQPGGSVPTQQGRRPPCSQQRLQEGTPCPAPPGPGPGREAPPGPPRPEAISWLSPRLAGERRRARQVKYRLRIPAGRRPQRGRERHLAAHSRRLREGKRPRRALQDGRLGEPRGEREGDRAASPGRPPPTPPARSATSKMAPQGGPGGP